MNKNKLSALITEAVFNFDPYNGADEEDVSSAMSEMLCTLEGCYEIIEQLCDMLNEAVD